MCFALPFHISEIDKNIASDHTGKKVKLDLVEHCKVGDFVLVQADIAVEKIDKKRAMLISQQLKQTS